MNILGRGQSRQVFMDEAVPQLGAIYRMALKNSGDPVLAEDLVQETFKEAWKSRRHYRSGSNCKAWLFKIYFRISNRHKTKTMNKERLSLDDIPERKLASKQAERDPLEQQEILGLLDTIPSTYRTVLVLADAEGLSYNEISNALEIPLGTVMSRLNRARGLFREKYQNRFGRIRSAQKNGGG